MSLITFVLKYIQGQAEQPTHQCQGDFLGGACEDAPLHTCYRCQKRLCELHAFQGDNHRYCYSCMYEK